MGERKRCDAHGNSWVFSRHGGSFGPDPEAQPPARSWSSPGGSRRHSSWSYHLQAINTKISVTLIYLLYTRSHFGWCFKKGDMASSGSSADWHTFGS